METLYFLILKLITWIMSWMVCLLFSELHSDSCSPTKSKIPMALFKKIASSEIKVSAWKTKPLLYSQSHPQPSNDLTEEKEAWRGMEGINTSSHLFCVLSFLLFLLSTLYYPSHLNLYFASSPLTISLLQISPNCPRMKEQKITAYTLPMLTPLWNFVTQRWSWSTC